MAEWIIDEEQETSREVLAEVQSNSTLSGKWPSFKRDVSTNPFYHPKPRRIVKLKESSYPDGTYRYRKDPLRVVYYPDQESKTIFPLEASTAKDVSYKKRSKR